MKKHRQTVGLVSFHPLFLTDFQRKLPTSFLPQVSKLESAIPVVEQANRLPRADVYAIDISSQTQLMYVLISALIERHTQCRILVLAEDISGPSAFPLLEVGIKGILQYADADSQFRRAVQSIATGGYWIPRSLLSRFVEQVLAKERGRRQALKGATRITRREQEILDGLLMNLSNKEIANRLNISERTVKFHVSNLLAKYRVQRRADLILLSFHSRQVVLSHSR
jgi:DNA-binding NarL/FixJ family response regulator